MINVWMCGPPLDALEIVRKATLIQGAYVFSSVRHWGAIPVRIDERESAAAYHVERVRGIRLAAGHAEKAADYAGFDLHGYYLGLAMLGLIQWRALTLNPMLQPTDLGHPEGTRCLFDRPLLPEEFALHLDHPHICPACQEFYGRLCPQEEMRALNKVIQDLQEQNNTAPCYA
jgi:hypothetical protein